MEKYYDVFHRTWYRWEFGKIIPGVGEKFPLQFHVTWKDAREMCQHWNASHAPGNLSDKAEFEESEE